MKAGSTTKVNIFVGLGIVAQIAGRVLMVGSGLIGLPLVLLGTVLFIIGCFHYADGKGYPRLLGLLGLLSCLGLIILVLLPDRHKE